MSDVSPAGGKAPARAAGEILADIDRERAELNSSFEALRKELDEALDAGRRRAGDIGKRAAVIGPVVVGVVAAAAAAALLIRRRSAKER